MTPGARIAAAIEVLDDILTRRRPAQDALKDWGLAHRFAGSKDRAAISSVVFDALRRKSSAAWIMQSDAPRAVVLGALRLQRGLPLDEIASLCSGERHAPAPLSEEERNTLASANSRRRAAACCGRYTGMASAAFPCRVWRARIGRRPRAGGTRAGRSSRQPAENHA